MRNSLTLLADLLNTKVKKQLSIVLSMAGENLWLVADSISDGEQIIEASGLTVGDYVLHEDRRLINNLGPVEISIQAV